MHRAACVLFAAFLGFAPSPSPGHQAPPAAPVAGEGIYQSRTMEVGSSLVLSPDGRFLWVFSYGALDLASQGRWSREADGTILLNSDPVTAPRFELVGRSRDERPGVAVRLACDSRQAAEYLDAVVEYADGERVVEPFEELEFRTPAESARQVAAVYVGSPMFDLLSDRVAVDAGANVFTFRFTPNDIFRAELRDQRLTVDGNFLTFTWRNLPLRYERQGSAAGEALPPLPPVPGSGADAAPVALEVQVDESLQGLQQRAGAALTSDPDSGVLVARGPVDLAVDYGPSRIDFGRAEGGRQPLMIAEGGHGEVGSLAFTLADRMPLDAALERARALQRSLAEAGFRPAPSSEYFNATAPFTILPEDGSQSEAASDWADAARRLGDEAQAIPAMELFELYTGRHMAEVRLENVRRHERNVCPHSDWQGEPGREWQLFVTLSPSGVGTDDAPGQH